MKQVRIMRPDNLVVTQNKAKLTHMTYLADTDKLQAISLNNFRKVPQLSSRLSPQQLSEIETVAQVLPFKANSYVVNELIDWNNVPDDPIYRLVFPHKDMLQPQHFNIISKMLKQSASKDEIKKAANAIRHELNPHPAGQLSHNIPVLDKHKLNGIQHKYHETILFFPQQGQTCHAYCTFCFRWPQFVGMHDLKFSMHEADLLVKYVQSHPEVSDVLFTGGDPMIMKTKRFEVYIDALLEANIPHLNSIRIGSKSLSYWPYRFTTDEDADDMLRLFERVVDSGISLAFMAHFNHHIEQSTPVVQTAVKRILSTGAQIRTQAPLMKYINDKAEIWATMWADQVNQGMIPYYMFLARDTGAQHYFAVPIAKAFGIYNQAFSSLSGLGRTARGPVMSTNPGKVHILGVTEVEKEKAFVFKFIQARNVDIIDKIYFAIYDEEAIWLDDFQPALGSTFDF